MPGFLSSPKLPLPPGTKRRFTLEQANRTLPLVSRIVNDVVRTHDKAMSVQARIESVGENKAATAPLHAELDRAMDRLQDYVAELAAVGCELKDYRTGLVDFIGRHRGRDVLLCWKLGEERLAFWHETTAGYAGRKPVSQLDERG
jgi:hypothetical protein